MSPILGIYASQISGHLFTPGNSYESIQTYTVGSGGSSTITFSSIPSTYKHLQLRCLVKTDRTSSNLSSTPITFNGDTANNYAVHNIEGNGTAASASAGTSQPAIDVGRVSGNLSSTNVFGVEIIDILDYANTNKYKTVRMLNGFDNNGSGVIAFNSGLWQSTSAITSITFGTPYSATVYMQYSSFALYGIRG